MKLSTQKGMQQQGMHPKKQSPRQIIQDITLGSETVQVVMSARQCGQIIFTARGPNVGP